LILKTDVQLSKDLNTFVRAFHTYMELDKTQKQYKFVAYNNSKANTVLSYKQYNWRSNNHDPFYTFQNKKLHYYKHHQYKYHKSLSLENIPNPWDTKIHNKDYSDLNNTIYNDQKFHIHIYPNKDPHTFYS